MERSVSQPASSGFPPERPPERPPEPLEGEQSLASSSGEVPDFQAFDGAVVEGLEVGRLAGGGGERLLFLRAARGGAPAVAPGEPRRDRWETERSTDSSYHRRTPSPAPAANTNPGARCSARRRVPPVASGSSMRTCCGAKGPLSPLTDTKNLGETAQDRAEPRGGGYRLTLPLHHQQRQRQTRLRRQAGPGRA